MNEEGGDDDEKYFDSFPLGIRFKPTDKELVGYYLKNKIMGRTLPRSRIRDVNLYNYSPHQLSEMYERHRTEEEWYFFTPRERKYARGKRPNRAAGNGYWKITVSDFKIWKNNRVIGHKNMLCYHEGNARDGGVKTGWLMHEYTLEGQSTRAFGDMKLDDWVLCKVYKKRDTSAENQSQNNQQRNGEMQVVGQAPAEPERLLNAVQQPQIYRPPPLLPPLPPQVVVQALQPERLLNAVRQPEIHRPPPLLSPLPLQVVVQAHGSERLLNAVQQSQIYQPPSLWSSLPPLLPSVSLLQPTPLLQQALPCRLNVNAFAPGNSSHMQGYAELVNHTFDDDDDMLDMSFSDIGGDIASRFEGENSY
ncbi:hypothetical protein U1Q18_012892 [Sarracenia purpurea var. burkii]